MDVGSLGKSVVGTGGIVDVCVSYSRVPVVSKMTVMCKNDIRICAENTAEGVVVDI